MEPPLRHKRSFSDLAAAPSASLPPGIGAGIAYIGGGGGGPGSPGTPVPPPLLDAFGSCSAAAAQPLPPLLDGLRPPEWDAAAGFDARRSNGLLRHGSAVEPPLMFSPGRPGSGGYERGAAANGAHPPALANGGSRLRGAAMPWGLAADGAGGGVPSSWNGAPAAAPPAQPKGGQLPVSIPERDGELADLLEASGGGGPVHLCQGTSCSAPGGMYMRAPPLTFPRCHQWQHLLCTHAEDAFVAVPSRWHDHVRVPSRWHDDVRGLRRAGGEGGAAWEDAWEEPGPRFRAWVQECVLRTLGRHCRPAAPDALRREEAVWAFRKAVRVVVDNEQKARPCCARKLFYHAPTRLCRTVCTALRRPCQATASPRMDGGVGKCDVIWPWVFASLRPA